MKKVIATAVAVAALTTSAFSEGRAIGIRGGGGSSFGGEVSYHHGMGESNRIEADLGWSGGDHWSVIGLTGIYHWEWNIKKGFGWFAGPGVSLGFYNFDNDNGNKDDDDAGLTLGLGGQVGIEYDFSASSVPIQVGLDVRPMRSRTRCRTTALAHR